MGSLANYFDYEAFARALFDWDYTMGANGNVFRRVCHSGHSESRAFPKGKALLAKVNHEYIPYHLTDIQHHTLLHFDIAHHQW